MGEQTFVFLLVEVWVMAAAVSAVVGGAAGDVAASEGVVVGPEVVSGWPTERLELEITSLAGHLAAAECRWLVFIGEFDRREGHLSWGLRSAAWWLHWRCGLSERAAYERVRVGRALLELPRVREAFSRGELSFSKVRALTRVAVPENEEALVGLAKGSTASQLERIVRGVRQVVDRNRDARRMHVERFLRFAWMDDGSLVIWARVPPDVGALVVEALSKVTEELLLESFVEEQDRGVELVDDEAARAVGASDGADTELTSGSSEGRDCSAERLDAGEGVAHEPHDGEEEGEVAPSDPWSARYADALERLCETALEHGTAPRSSRYQVSVHAELDDINGAFGEVRLANGVALSSEVAERLLCDCDTVPVVEVGGEPVYAGSKSPSVPRRMRRQIEARDRHCRFPGCTEARFVEVHHVIWRSHHGPTEVWNLCLLCRRHHRLVHHRGFRIEGVDGALSFFRPDGTPIPEVPGTDPVEGPGIVEAHRLAGVDVDPEAIVGTWCGERLDAFALDVAVEGLAKHLIARHEDRSAEHRAGCPNRDHERLAAA